MRRFLILRFRAETSERLAQLDQPVRKVYKAPKDSWDRLAQLDQQVRKVCKESKAIQDRQD